MSLCVLCKRQAEGSRPVGQEVTIGATPSRKGGLAVPGMPGAVSDLHPWPSLVQTHQPCVLAGALEVQREGAPACLWSKSGQALQDC